MAKFIKPSDDDRPQLQPLTLLRAMTTLTPAATLRASLERHNEEFESLLKLIPARFYLVQDDEEQVYVFLNWLTKFLCSMFVFSLH